MKNSDNSAIFKYEERRFTQKIALRKALHLENIELLLSKLSQLRSTLEFSNGHAQGLKAKKILGVRENWWQCYGNN